MMKTALGLGVILAVLCLGQGDHPEPEFPFGLYRQLTAFNTEGKNVFFSPVSVSLALGALSVGARGQTHQQLGKGLGFKHSQLTHEVMNTAFLSLLKILKSDMDVGGALYIDDTFKVNSEFKRKLQKFYLSDSFNIDFTQTAEAIDTINTYVGEKTRGKIDKLVTDLDPLTVMYLISYIYYKGTWEVPFDPRRTKEEPFHVNDQTEVQVQMMHVEDHFSTYYDKENKATILHLNYNDSNSMILALPDKGNDLSAVETAICRECVAKWIKGKKFKNYKLAIPKFSIKTSYTLNEMLVAMGMSDMFSDRADFSGISGYLPVKVSKVVHQATLNVDEFGATAAAVTGVGIVMRMSFTPPAPQLKFDRPFMILIIDSVTNTILFMGKIVNPKE